MAAKEKIKFSTKEEVIVYLQRLSLPEHMRRMRDALVNQLKDEAPHFSAKNANEFINGNKKYKGVNEVFEVAPKQKPRAGKSK